MNSRYILLLMIVLCSSIVSAAPYNLTNISDAETPADTIHGVNEMTGGKYALVSLIIIFIVLVSSFVGAPIAGRFAAASLITTIIAIMLRMGDLVGDYTIAFFILVTAGSVVALKLSN